MFSTCRSPVGENLKTLPGWCFVGGSTLLTLILILSSCSSGWTIFCVFSKRWMKSRKRLLVFALSNLKYSTYFIVNSEQNFGNNFKLNDQRVTSTWTNRGCINDLNSTVVSDTGTAFSELEASKKIKSSVFSRML